MAYINVVPNPPLNDHNQLALAYHLTTPGDEPKHHMRKAHKKTRIVVGVM